MLIEQMVNLNQLQKAYSLSEEFEILNKIQKIGTLSLKQNNLDLAIKCFKKIKNVSMVLSLKKLQRQRKGTFGYLGDLSVILCDYTSALRMYFIGGEFDKIIFLCEELKDFDLALDLLRFIKENLNSGNFLIFF